jgi:L-arabinose isomerase
MNQRDEMPVKIGLFGIGHAPYWPQFDGLRDRLLGYQGQIANSRYRFSLGARGFVDEWCKNGRAHHCAIGVGHLAEQLQKLASLFGIEAIRVC